MLTLSLVEHLWLLFKQIIMFELEKIMEQILPSKSETAVKSYSSTTSNCCMCKICEKMFHDTGTLKQHVLVHTNERPYPCKRCDKRFKRSGDLTVHVKVVHDKIKDHVCEICSCEFGRKQDLNKHIRCHTGVRDYVCMECNMKFTRSCHLRRHERNVHWNGREKIYKCTYCSKTVNSRWSLKCHNIRQHTKKFPYCCKVCSKGFLKPGILNSHMMKKHA